MVEYEPVFFDIETTGLDPMNETWMERTFDHVKFASQVTCIGLGTMKGWEEAGTIEDCQVNIDTLWDDSEYRLLSVAHDRMKEKVGEIDADGREPFIVSFNGREFDHPYLGARYSRKRQDGRMFNWLLKRLDMKRVASKDSEVDKRFPSQDYWAERLGIVVEDQWTGKDMPRLFEQGRWDDIAEHCRLDLQDLMDIFVRKKELAFEVFYDHYDDVHGDPPKFTEGGEY